MINKCIVCGNAILAADPRKYCSECEEYSKAKLEREKIKKRQDYFGSCY